jgi:hypothetical protein
MSNRELQDGPSKHPAGGSPVVPVASGAERPCSPASMVVAHEIRGAADLLTYAWGRALLCGDRDQADRLRDLARLVHHEAGYARDRDRGHVGIVRRRTDAPADAVVGWWLRYCTATRAVRRLYGLSLTDGDLSREVA